MSAGLRKSSLTPAVARSAQCIQKDTGFRAFPLLSIGLRARADGNPTCDSISKPSKPGFQPRIPGFAKFWFKSRIKLQKPVIGTLLAS
ncbi:MAG TPA: hypothetical protein DEA96_02440 [Leptospiraceae bacterium]|nr:hypothetical protein [Spirochaetaceae bacterium]HBS03794.1 hypothetical protein [Leptospiraceae bacterium]